MESDSNLNLARRRRILLGILTLLWLSAGIVEGIRPSPEAALRDALFALAHAWLLEMWCSADAALRGRPLGHAWRWMIFLFWFAAVPAYLVWSRGLKGVLTTIGLAALLLGCLSAGVFVGDLVRLTSG